MSPLLDLLTRRAGLDAGAVDHLRLLLEDWQILADLSFADLLVFVVHDQPDGRRKFLCVGQMRPLTAQTVYTEDLVGQAFSARVRPMVARAFSEGRVIRDADPDWSTGVPVREEAIPVRHRGRVVAVVTREANVSTARSPSQLELTYLQTAGELVRMLAEGTFPYGAYSLAEERELSPRVGDGIMRLGADGVVVYASPNAISAYRRLGSLDNVIGQHLAAFDPEPEATLRGLAAGEPVETEVERGGAVVLRRVLPLLAGGALIAGLILIREVTELRHHERALRVKDATIREIHHRVKNNLQTVASLLRLQGRRLHSDEARAALAESVRRISSIALVHETLSQESREHVSFDRVAGRIVEMLGDGLVNPDTPIVFALEGEAGDLPAEVATPLALVLAELLQNCVEHAFVEGSATLEEPASDGAPGDNGWTPRGTGHVWVRFERGFSTLRVLVVDDGVGLPAGQTLAGIANLGLQIARTLVESELGGTFGVIPPGPPDVSVGQDASTVFELVLPLP